MARLLFAWELGSGYGHLSNFLGLARTLRARGHALSVALADPSIAAPFSDALGDDVHTGPPHPAPRADLPQPGSIAELLLGLGFDDVATTTARIERWLQIYRDSRCDLVIGEHAPWAMVAGHVARVPRVLWGNGFTCPPPVHPSPPLLTLAPPDRSALAQSEQRMLQVLDAVCTRYHRPLPEGTCSIYADAPCLLYSIAELDPFSAQRSTGHYLGARSFPGATEIARWRDDRAPRIFCYLRADTPLLKDLLNALAARGGDVLAHVPNLDPGLAEPLARLGVRFSGHPVDMRTLGDDCDLVVCNASHGTTLRSVLHGLPLLLVPTDQEKLMYARCVQQIGCGLTIMPQLRTPNWDALLDRLLGDTSFGDHARAVMQRHVGSDESASTEHAADLIEQSLSA